MKTEDTVKPDLGKLSLENVTTIYVSAQGI